MSNDPSPLKYMGTQSHETMAMEAALAQRPDRSSEQAADIAAEGTVISDATNWAIDKASADRETKPSKIDLMCGFRLIRARKASRRRARRLPVVLHVQYGRAKVSSVCSPDGAGRPMKCMRC